MYIAQSQSSSELKQLGYGVRRAVNDDVRILRQSRPLKALRDETVVGQRNPAASH